MSLKENITLKKWAYSATMPMDSPQKKSGIDILVEFEKPIGLDFVLKVQIRNYLCENLIFDH